LFRTYILYKQELFDEEYRQVFEKYPNCMILKECDFHSDLVRILEQVDTKYILFGIDDVVYFDGVDFDVIDGTFDKHGDDIFGFSLRFGREFVEGCGDPISGATTGDQTVYRLDWKQGRTATTRYPFELCATIYRAGLVKEVVNGLMNKNPLVKGLFSPGTVLVRALESVKSARRVLKRFGYFFSPNTFESWCCRWCQRHADGLASGIYFQKSCASAIQVNKVNTSTGESDEGSAEHTVEALAEKYGQGYRLDIGHVAKMRPVDTHAGDEFFKLVQEQQDT
jgi:hypothetical protein